MPSVTGRHSAGPLLRRSAAPRTSCGRRTVLTAVRRARRRHRRPDRRDPDRLARSAPRSSRSTTRCSASSAPREVVGVRPETREEANDPALVGAARRRDRHLHDRRQPAQAVGGDRRHRVRRGDPGRPPRAASPSAAPPPARASSPRTWSRSAPAASTPKQRMTQLAAGLGLLRGLRDRPALRAAQPLRPAADARRAEPPAARHRRRRGHRRRDHPRRRAPSAARWSAAARSRSSTARSMVSNAHEAKRTAPLLASGVAAARAARRRARST